MSENKRIKLLTISFVLVAVVGSVLLFSSNKTKKELAQKELNSYESMLEVIRNEELPRRYAEPYFFKTLFENEQYSNQLAYEVALKMSETNMERAYRNLEYINESLNVSENDYLELNDEAGISESVSKELEFRYEHAKTLIENNRLNEAYDILNSSKLANYKDSSELAKSLKDN